MLLICLLKQVVSRMVSAFDELSTSCRLWSAWKTSAAVLVHRCFPWASCNSEIKINARENWVIANTENIDSRLLQWNLVALYHFSLFSSIAGWKDLAMQYFQRMFEGAYSCTLAFILMCVCEELKQWVCTYTLIDWSTMADGVLISAIEWEKSNKQKNVLFYTMQKHCLTVFFPFFCLTIFMFSFQTKCFFPANTTACRRTFEVLVCQTANLRSESAEADSLWILSKHFIDRFDSFICTILACWVFLTEFLLKFGCQGQCSSSGSVLFSWPNIAEQSRQKTLVASLFACVKAKTETRQAFFEYKRDNSTAIIAAEILHCGDLRTSKASQVLIAGVISFQLCALCQRKIYVHRSLRYLN